MTYNKRKHLKILLLQIRQDEETIEEEIRNFAAFGKLDRRQIQTLNAFDEPYFKINDLAQFDALFVGGSSDASVLEPQRFPFVKSCCALIRHCYEKNIPTLASCFGFELAVVELGGEVILDKESMEMGIVTINLTPNAHQYPLLKNVTNSFYAVSGHKERALRLPPDCIPLASSDKCPYHLFTFKNKPFYGFQFHPEVDRKTLTERLTRYFHHYYDRNDGQLEQILEASQMETPVSNQLVEQFVDKIIL